MKLRTLLLSAVAITATAILAVQAQVPGVNSTLNSVFTLAYDNSTMKPTYSSTVAFAPATPATDVCTLTGSATKNIRVRRILFNLVATTAVSDPIAVIKRSTANTGGTTAQGIEVPYDSANGAATATFTAYTANPTLGTSVGLITDPIFSVGNLTTGGAQTFPSQLLFGQLGQPIVLRGVAQQVSVNLNGWIFAGGSASCTFEWTEE